MTIKINIDAGNNSFLSSASALSFFPGSWGSSTMGDALIKGVGYTRRKLRKRDLFWKDRTGRLRKSFVAFGYAGDNKSPSAAVAVGGFPVYARIVLYVQDDGAVYKRILANVQQLRTQIFDVIGKEIVKAYTKLYNELAAGSLSSRNSRRLLRSEQKSKSRFSEALAKANQKAMK